MKPCAFVVLPCLHALSLHYLCLILPRPFMCPVLWLRASPLPDVNRIIVLYYFFLEMRFLHVANNVDYPFLQSLGTHLKKTREGMGITQAQLAIDCDVDVSVISRIELGKINTSVNNLRLIAAALDLDIRALFSFLDSMPTAQNPD